MRWDRMRSEGEDSVEGTRCVGMEVGKTEDDKAGQIGKPLVGDC